jgi:hypothetical protein
VQYTYRTAKYMAARSKTMEQSSKGISGGGMGWLGRRNGMKKLEV